MLHLVSARKEMFFDDERLYEEATIQDVIEYLKRCFERGWTCLDLETRGFDCHTKEVLSLQVGDLEEQYVVDGTTENLLLLKFYLERLLLIGQNLKFDLKFLYKLGIFPKQVYDTMIVEKILYCGISTIRVALDELTYRYLGFKLDKSVRGDIIKEGLTSRVVRYAGDDVKYLPAIREKQLEELEKKGLKGTANLENRFVPVLAYIEYCGFHLDSEKWKAKMVKDQERVRIAEEKLNYFILDRGMTKYFKKQLSLFDPLECSINWSSSPQVVTLFEEFGIDCTVIEKGVPKKSVEAGHLEQQRGKFDILPLYLEFKKAEKVTSTYGESFLKQINKETGRIHTSFKQIMDTGRLSCGGKDKAQKLEFVNLQNIPADKETRACFTAQKGSTLIVSDYSGQEQVVLANRALDKNLLKFYDDGLADMHSFVASKMYPKLEGLTLDEIKSKYKNERGRAKSAGFAINYGGNGQTIADNLGLSVEEGNKIYTAYFVAFPGLKTYFDKVKKQGLRDGYVMISNLTGRKSYIEFFEDYVALRDEIEGNEDFWDLYRFAKAQNTPAFPGLKEKVSKYFRFKGDIERKTLNFPIQGSSAEITKISCIYIFDYILDHNLQNVVKFVNTVHDENVLECPVEMSKKIAEVVAECMNRAGDIYCKRVPLRAVPEITTYWQK